MPSTALDTASEADTSAVGERLAAELPAGAVVLLTGELGAGKTAFVRGLVRGRGVPDADVSSPTFTLIQEYAGRSGTVYHVDLYRLSGAEVHDLGLDELIGSGALVAIEWAERWSDPPAGAVEVRMEHAGGDRRRITITRPT